MFLSSLCHEFKTSCERVYEQVFALSGSQERATSTASRGEYEKLRRDNGGDRNVRLPETMDREMAKELVELAVSGVEIDTKLEKTKRPGGETFSVPSNISSSNRSLASQSLKELGANASSESAHIEFCREMENRTYSRLRVITDEESALKVGEAIYLLDNTWFEQWLQFLNGGNRPGPIRNSGLDRETGEWGRTYVGLDAKGWGVLSDLYTYDVALIKEYD